MSGEGPGSDPEFVDARIPGALWNRIRELFVAERGYEPSSPQEALGFLCDRAEAEIDDRTATDVPSDGQTESVPLLDDSTVEADDSDPDAATPALQETDDADPEAAIGTAPQSVIDVIEEVFPERWNDRAFGQRYLPPVLDEYVDCVEQEIPHPEQAALERVADRSADDAEAIRDGLVGCLYRSGSLPDEVASEFFSEALDAAHQRVRERRDERNSDDAPPVPDSDDIELAEHGGLSSETTFEGTPMETPDLVASEEDVSFDDLVDDLDATSDPMVPDVADIESLLDTEHTDRRVREVAGELLDEMTGELFDEIENGVDHGTGAGVADGTGMLDAEDRSTGDAGGASTGGHAGFEDGSVEGHEAEQSTDRTRDGPSEDPNDDGRPSESDSIPGPLNVNPETDCDRCGESYQVSDLETTLDPQDGIALLLCPDCSSS